MNLGYHIREKINIKEQQELIEKYGFTYIQIYVIGPNNSYEIYNPEEKKEIKEMGVKKLVHGSHLDHLYGYRHKFTIMNIKKELEISREIMAEGLIIHLPNKSVNKIVSALDEIIENDVSNSQEIVDWLDLPLVTIYLEMNSYGKTDKYKYTELKNIKALFKIIKTKSYYNRIGLGIDTAHLWASGVDISEYKLVKDWLSKISELEIPNIILQLNDQKWEYGEGSDEHVSLTYGTIWKKYNKEGFNNIFQSGLMAFLEWAKEEEIITIMERKRKEEIERDMITISKL